MEINRNLSKQPFQAGSGRITQKNSLRDYPHLLKSPDFRLLVLKCAGSYSRIFTVLSPRLLTHGPRKLGPYFKTSGLVFHGTALASAS